MAGEAQPSVWYAEPSAGLHVVGPGCSGARALPKLCYFRECKELALNDPAWPRLATGTLTGSGRQVRTGTCNLENGRLRGCT